MTKIPEYLPSHFLQKARVGDLSKTKAQNALLILMKCPELSVQVIRSTLRISSKYLHLKKKKNNTSIFPNKLASGKTMFHIILGMEESPDIILVHDFIF